MGNNLKPKPNFNSTVTVSLGSVSQPVCREIYYLVLNINCMQIMEETEKLQNWEMGRNGVENCGWKGWNVQIFVTVCNELVISLT